MLVKYVGKKVCWWRIFWMLVKLYVGRDENSNVFWWSMLVKVFLYVSENANIQFYTYLPTYNFTNVFFSNITALKELHVGESLIQNWPVHTRMFQYLDQMSQKDFKKFKILKWFQVRTLNDNFWPILNSNIPIMNVLWC